MTPTKAPRVLRLVALALIIPLLWLAQQAGRAGVAGIYGASAAAYRQDMSDSDSRSQQWSNALAEGERSIALARELAPEHPAYALQAADFASDRGQYQAAFDVLRSTLPLAPVRADIWSRLARNGYFVEGPSVATLYALDRALYFGPREYDALLVNAMITLNSGDGLAVERQLRGWNGIVDAVGMPGLAARIDRLVIGAGKERQLQVLLRQRAQQAEALEQRAQERGGAG